jgi:hypothetical protein
VINRQILTTLHAIGTLQALADTPPNDRTEDEEWRHAGAVRWLSHLLATAPPSRYLLCEDGRVERVA